MRPDDDQECYKYFIFPKMCIWHESGSSSGVLSVELCLVHRCLFAASNCAHLNHCLRGRAETDLGLIQCLTRLTFSKQDHSIKVNSGVDKHPTTRHILLTWPGLERNTARTDQITLCIHLLGFLFWFKLKRNKSIHCTIYDLLFLFTCHKLSLCQHNQGLNSEKVASGFYLNSGEKTDRKLQVACQFFSIRRT